MRRAQRQGRGAWFIVVRRPAAAIINGMKHAIRSLVLLLALAPLARAEVVESSASSLAIKYVLTLSMPPEKAWPSVIDIAKWWGSDHTFSGNAANLHLDARAGGCWCETLPSGGSVQHMSVLTVMPNQRLVLAGALGPLQTAGVSGAMTFQLKAKELTVTYNVGGYYPGGLSSVASIVDQVLGSQLTRLQRLIDTGSAEERSSK